jgi:hypothetical protein
MSKDKYRLLIKEISRIKKAQERMAATNDALERDDAQALSRFKLPPPLIAHLLQRKVKGQPGYPAYLFKHNQEYLDVLKMRLEKLST